MARLIDADALKQKITMVTKQYKPNAIMERPAILLEDVDEAPTIEAEPIRYGEWIGKPMIGGYSRMRCSVCDNVFLDNKEKWNYCPHCGARMVNENENAD